MDILILSLVAGRVLVQHPFCKFLGDWFWLFANFPPVVMRARSARRAKGGKFAQNHRQGQQSGSSGLFC